MMNDIRVVATDNHIYIDCLNITPEIRDFMDNLEACNMVDPTYRPGCYMVHPDITKHLKFEDDRVILGRRWCEDLCRRGGIGKYAFIAWQIAGYQILEQIHQGMVDIRYFVGNNEYMVEWGPTEERSEPGEAETKKLIKRTKRRFASKSQVGCPVHGKKIGNHAPFFSWMCCMCNKHEKVIAIAK